MKHRRLSLIAVMQGLVLALGVPALAQAQDKPKASRPDMVLKDDAKCTRCHDETEEYPLLVIGKTRHGVKADHRTPTCTTCHGESETHVNKPADAKDRPKPDRLYGGFLAKAPVEDRVERYFGVAGKRSATPIEDRNAPCLSCHEGGKRIHWSGSTHAARDVACTNCHQIHIANEMVLDKASLRTRQLPPSRRQ